MNQNLAAKLAPRFWRTAVTHERYHTERTERLAEDVCPFCTETPAQKFTHWFILPNKYPYDAVAEVHDLIVPFRHVALFEELTPTEQEELQRLKSSYLNTDYDYVLEAMPKNKSIPGHLHYHLIRAKVIT